MRAKTPEQLPVRIAFDGADGRGEGWGRLSELSAAGTRLSTLSALRRGEIILLTFEIAGECFAQTRARVSHAQRDDDGFCEAEVDFESPLDRRRLARELLDLLSR